MLAIGHKNFQCDRHHEMHYLDKVQDKVKMEYAKVDILKPYFYVLLVLYTFLYTFILHEIFVITNLRTEIHVNMLDFYSFNCNALYCSCSWDLVGNIFSKTAFHEL